MHWLIDESQTFIFQDTSPKKWKIAVVGGGILPFKNRNQWLKISHSIKKGSEYVDEHSISEVLDILIACRVKGIVICADVGHVSKREAEQFRKDWIEPHYEYADKQEDGLRASLRRHLDNLMGLGENKLSLQDFFKTISILDMIRYFIEWTTNNLKDVRDVDLRKISLIIDDQTKAAQLTLRYYVHYFLFRRSYDGLFTCPPNSIHKLKKYIRTDKYGQTYLDTTKLLKNKIVGDNLNQDFKSPELKIADLISNFSRRILNGHYSLSLAVKLRKVVIKAVPLCFHNDHDVIADLPSSNQDAIKLILEGY